MADSAPWTHRSAIPVGANRRDPLTAAGLMLQDLGISVKNPGEEWPLRKAGRRQIGVSHRAGRVMAGKETGR